MTGLQFICILGGHVAGLEDEIGLWCYYPTDIALGVGSYAQGVYNIYIGNCETACRYGYVYVMHYVTY